MDPKLHLERNGNDHPIADVQNLKPRQGQSENQQPRHFNCYALWFCVVLLAFVNIPDDARIVNWSRDQICRVCRPLQVENIFAVKSAWKMKIINEQRSEWISNQDPIRFQMDIFAGEKNKKLCTNEMTSTNAKRSNQYHYFLLQFWTPWY